VRRHGRVLPLRWRAAALASGAIAMLSVVASAAAFVVVRSSLQGELQDALHADAMRVAQLYQAGGAGSARDVLAGPTGGVVVQLYDPMAHLLVASDVRYEVEAAALPAATVMEAREAGEAAWRGTLAGESVQVALVPFELGVVAVVGETGFIGRALGQLARALSVTAVVVVLLSALVGFTVANAIVRPITVLARQASALGPERLGAIPYDGPHDEVGQLADVLNDLLTRLRQALDAQRSFLAETSHELRTPLTSLQGFLGRAARQADPAVHRELADARRIAHAMSRMVTDLLQLSRGQLVSEIDPHLVDLAEDVVKPVAEEVPGVEVVTAGSPTVVGDPERLRQLVRNLVSNAVRAAGDPSAVTVAATLDGDDAVLEVHDTGPGVPEELQHRIFQKFFRGQGGGAGLGLAICQQIAEAHGSKLTFVSVPGDTRFTLRLHAAELSDDGGDA
jgi:two-component system, OmpR family, sensor kinase